MKIYSRIGATVLLVAASLLVGPVEAGGLLGNVLGGSGGGVVNDLLGGGSSGGGGGLIGNNGLVDLDTSGDGNFGVTGIATINLGTEGGTSAGVTVLGGNGHNDLDLPLGGLLGGNSNLGIDLPGLGGLMGSNGDDGAPGAPGRPGRDGVNGVNGSNGYHGNNGRNGGAGGVLTLNTSKLKFLLAMLQNRAWLRFAAGNAVCLPGYGVANIQGWLPQKDMPQMQQLVASYAQDIYTLRTMLSKCRAKGGRIGEAELNRAIAVDIQNGMPVLFVL